MALDIRRLIIILIYRLFPAILLLNVIYYPQIYRKSFRCRIYYDNIRHISFPKHTFQRAFPPVT